MEEKILFTVEKDNIARLTLNHPQVHNAFDQDMVQKITAHLKKIHEEPTLRALILQGNGESFCAGANLSSLERSSQSRENESFEEARTLGLMLYLLDTLPIPTISYIHGAVMGGGIGIAACCDIVLSDAEARFAFSETKLGLVPAVISPYVLRAIGTRYVRRYFLTGETFNTSVAHQMGLVHEVVALANKEAEINKIVNYILAGGPSAVMAAKRLVRQITGDILENTRLMTIELIASLRLSEESQQGITAFLNKTLPPWVPKEK